MSQQNFSRNWGPPHEDFNRGRNQSKQKVSTITEFVDFYTDFDTNVYYSRDNAESGYINKLTQNRLENPHPDKKHGWEYRIFINTDKNNFNAGDTVLVKRQVYGLGSQQTQKWEVVTQTEILEKLRNNSEVKDLLKDYLTKNFNENDIKKKALTASGNDAFVNGEKDMSEYEITSDPENTSVIDPTINPAEVTPQKLRENYKTIFKSIKDGGRDLKYPIDMFSSTSKESNSQDYIYFEQFLYRPPQESRGRFERTNIDGKVELDQTDVASAMAQGIGSNKRIREAQGSCILPIPNKLGISNGVSWGEARANAIEFSAFNAASGSVQNVSNNAFRIFNELNNLRKQGGNILDTAFSQLKKGQSGEATSGSIVNAVVAKALLSRLNINVDVDQFITRQTGSAINPNLELLFSGPQLRTFSFQFNFAPNSKDEANEVRLIQRWFREGMLPRKNNLSTGGATLFLGSPNVFRICYKNNGRRIKGLNTFKICALTSCEIDFTPDGLYQSYEDVDAVSQPVRTTMAVTFNELTPIFSNDYSSSLNDDGDFDDPTLDDVKVNITGDNKFTEDDLGF